jgi:hypothetical protein
VRAREWRKIIDELRFTPQKSRVLAPLHGLPDPFRGD